MYRTLANTEEAPVIDGAALRAGIAKASTIYAFKSPAAANDLKAFAKKLADDRELLRTTWSVPAGDVCMTFLALALIIRPVALLARKTITTAHELAASGVRALVAEQYLRVARDLENDVFTGKFGIGRLVEVLNMEHDPNAKFCPSSAQLADLRKRVLFVIGRIQIALETYVELDDMRPWFAKNRVVDAVVDVLLGIGGFAVAIATWSGRIVNTAADLIDKTARAVDIAIKASVIGLGIWVYLKYFKEGDAHAGR